MCTPAPPARMSSTRRSFSGPGSLARGSSASLFRLGGALRQTSPSVTRTPTVARTLLQPALAVTFGWKAAVWLSMLARSLAGTRSAAADACILQFGGPSGTLASVRRARRRRDAALARPRAAGEPCSPAQRARPLRAARRRAGDPRRRRRQDRPRCLPADAAGGRGRRGGEGRTRRLLEHAA